MAIGYLRAQGQSKALKYRWLYSYDDMENLLSGGSEVQEN